MKACFVVIFATATVATVIHASGEGGPVSKVFQMLADLESKIIKQGTDSQKTYDEFSGWCEDRSKNVAFEIKTGKAGVASVSATIEKETAISSSLGTKIEELAASLASDAADVKAANEIRSSEAADFAAEEKETTEVIGTLERAIAILNRKLAQGAGSMLQLKGTENMAQAFAVMVQASVLSSADATRLTALVQSNQDSESADGDATLGAPSTAAYKGHMEGVLGTLEDLLDKATAQLESARRAEKTSTNNYALLKQSLEDEITATEKDMADAKKNLAASQESKAVAEGDLSVTSADLKEDEATLGSLHQDCMTGSEDFQAEAKNRGEELKALGQAKKILADALPAAAQTYGAALDQVTDFLQVSRSELASGADLAKFEAVRLIRDLAHKEHSVELAQLASRMSSVIRFGNSAGSDPFTKVKALVVDMIAKLEQSAKADLTQKSFCDKETSETTQKKDEKKNEISKLGTQVESMSARSAQLKENMATIQNQLAQLASAQAEMDKIRIDEKALFGKKQAEMEAGISGVQKASSILRDYYANKDKAESGGGIISLLEVVVADFSKGLSQMEEAESTAAREYEKTSKMNEFTKLAKGKDLEYKAKEAAGLDKSVAESTSDKDGVQAELDALLEYLAKLGKMCIAKAEPFAERRARREAELAGLKEALAILQGEAALIQKSEKRAFRGKQAQLRHTTL